jgi:hypothetical protein
MQLEGFAGTIPSEMTNEDRLNSYVTDRAQSVIDVRRATKKNSLLRFQRLSASIGSILRILPTMSPLALRLKILSDSR